MSNDVTIKEPGQRNWPSALSRIAEPFRAAVQEHARSLLSQKDEARTQDHQDLSILEQKMLVGGRALSMITYAGFLPYHLLRTQEIQGACDLLRSKGPVKLMEQLSDLAAKAQVLLLIGDDPTTQMVDKAINECRKEGEIKSIIAGPGNLMEGALRAWALENNWPNAFLHSVDGSMGEVWHAQAGEAIDTAVAQLFDVHRPTRVGLIHPVRLPATQASIEQASHRAIPMTVIKVESISKIRF
jgi:hypothetical protein